MISNTLSILIEATNLFGFLHALVKFLSLNYRHYVFDYISEPAAIIYQSMIFFQSFEKHQSVSLSLTPDQRSDISVSSSIQINSSSDALLYLQIQGNNILIQETIN